MPELFVWWQAVETVWMNVPMLDVFERQTSTHRHSHVGTSFPEDCTPSVRHGHVQKAPERHWITVRCFGMSREEAAEGASTMMLDEIATYKAKQAKKKAKSFS